MASEAERHQRRADELGDAMRRFAVGANTGGIAIVAALLGKGAAFTLWPWDVWLPVGLFAIGLVLTGFSIGFQKHKALKRRDAALKDEIEPEFKARFERNQTWNGFALGFFALGAAIFIASKIPLC